MNKFNFLVAFIALCTFSNCYANRVWPLPAIEEPCAGSGIVENVGVLGAGNLIENGLRESAVAVAAGPVIAENAGLLGGNWVAERAGLLGAGNLIAAENGLRNAEVAAAAAVQQPHKVVVHEQSRPLNVVAKQTNVAVNHPRLTINARPVVVRRRPDVVVSPVLVQRQLPPIRVRQLYVKRVQPVENIVVQRAVATDVRESDWVRAGSNVVSGVGLVGSGLVGSGVVESGLVGPGLVGPGIVESGLVGPGLVGSGLVGSGLVGSGLVESGLVGPGLVGPGLVGPGIVGSGLVGGLVGAGNIVAEANGADCITK